MTRLGRFSAILGASLSALLTCAAMAAADPAVSLPANEAASTRWDGAAVNARLGNVGLANAGDINQDGRNDIVASTGGASSGAYVLFTPEQPARTLATGASIPVTGGYQIQSTGGVQSVGALGDQNDDGVPDLLVTDGSGVTYVVYGVTDPTSLPLCADAPNITRCQDVADLGADAGYAIETGVIDAATSSSGVGDVNGDGIEDVGISAVTSSFAGPGSGSAYVVFGGSAPPSGTLVLDGLPANQAVRIDGPEPDSSFGQISRAGDIDADGLDDVQVSMIGAGTIPSTGYVFFGSSLTTSPISSADFDQSMGLQIRSGIVTPYAGSNAGDVNGDGFNDLIVGMAGLIAPTGAAAIVYGTDDPPADPIVGNPIDPSRGYGYSEGDTGTRLGSSPIGLGDVNGDGIPDQAIGARATPIAGVAGAGAAYVLFGKRPAPAETIPLGASLTPANGIAFTGSTANQNLGTLLAPMGDVDGDGLPDALLGAPGARENGLNGSGSIYLILGREYMPTASTGLAGSVEQTSANVSGTASANGRASEAYFQYGPTAAYGSQTAPIEIGSGNGISFVEEAVTGLSANSSYHYRLVVRNDLGLEAYGSDRTFTTGTPDNGGPACDANPKAPGCSGYVYCQDAAHSGEAVCKSPTAAFGQLVAAPKSIKVKRGKKGSITVVVTNAGNGGASGVKVCASAPKKLVRIKGRCKNVGSMAAGSSRALAFKVKVKKGAKKGKKATVKFTASANGLGSKKTRAKVKVG